MAATTKTTRRRAAEARRQRRAQQRQRSLLGAILLVVVVAVGFGLLFGLHAVGGAIRPQGSASAVYTTKVAVIGVADRTTPTAVDAEVLQANQHQVGAVLTGGRCPASGWASLSAGTEVEVSCDFRVTDLGVIDDWADRQAEAARSGGTLGALAAAGQECIGAVGPGAALAAARPDGTVADYLDVDSFVAANFPSTCGVTFIDAGDRSDDIIAALAAQDEWTVVVTGVGGSAQVQQIYRLQTTLPGWLTADSTNRTGIVTLPDLSHSLRTVVAGVDAASDPAAMKVVENGGVPTARLAEHLAQTNRLVSPPYGPISVVALVFALGGFVGIGLWWQARRPLPTVDPHDPDDVDELDIAVANRAAVRTSLTVVTLLAATFPAGLLAAGVIGWWRTGGPETNLVGSVLIVWILMAGVSWLGAHLVASRVSSGEISTREVARRVLLPSALVVTFGIYLADAALGGYLHRSSLIASRPMTQFTNFGGAAMAVLITSGLALLILATAPWWRALGARIIADGHDDGPAAVDDLATKPRRRLLPYQLLWRPITAATVVAALVLGIAWASRTPTAMDIVGFGIAMAWCVATGWLLARTTRV